MTPRRETSSLPWRALCAAASEGYAAPTCDRDAVDRAAGAGAAAYGELLPDSAARLLSWLSPGPSDVLYDLGSGTGKLLVQAVCTTAVGKAVFQGAEIAGPIALADGFDHFDRDNIVKAAFGLTVVL